MHHIELRREIFVHRAEGSRTMGIGTIFNVVEVHRIESQVESRYVDV